MAIISHYRHFCMMTIDSTTKSFFRDQLYAWAEANLRPLPWKNEPDPYLIWLSEIILQQTRVAQGTPYYEKFKSRFPTVYDLAEAPEDEVLKLWQGLGYYSRARNLHQTAQDIVREYGGRFPATYEQIRGLKGVGVYTAAAIASFAFQMPYAVLDGNVSRVLSRFFGIATPIDAQPGKQLFQDLANQLLDQESPGKFNQRIMDFGATHCMPKQPLCGNCPMQSQCVAFDSRQTQSLPVKHKKLKKTTRHFHYLILQCQGETIIRKRTGEDIWRHLFEFPMVELAEPGATFHEVQAQAPYLHTILQPDNLVHVQLAGSTKQQLTHQTILASFWELEIGQFLPEQLPADLICINWKNLDKFAFPRIIDWYLKDNSLNLFSQLQVN